MYKVGQMVKVVNKKYDTYGQIGKITSVDVAWSHPYELDIDDELLYGNNDIQLVIDTSGKTQQSIENSIAELIVRMASEPHTRENALTITKLQEARMWFIEGKNIHGN